MGCDYYEILYLNVEYLDNLNKVQTVSTQLRKVGHFMYGNYDSDSEEDYDRKLDQQMDKTEKRYGTKILFENGGWVITNKDKQKEYMNFALKYVGGQMDKINKIYKNVVCYER